MERKKSFTRRRFVKASAAAVTASLVIGRRTAASGNSQSASTEEVPQRPLGNFFDNCWEYHDGVSEERLGAALKGKRDKAFVMTKVCTHGRGKDVAMKQLEESLRRLQTDHLDLWQIHEVVYYNDPDLIFAANGAAEALLAAKKQGKVRFMQLRAAGFAGSKKTRDCGARHEESGWKRGNCGEWGGDGRRGIALRNELAGGHDHQRYRFHGRVGAKPQSGARISAVCGGADGTDTRTGPNAGRRRAI